MKELQQLLHCSLLPERNDAFDFPFPESFLYYDLKIDPAETPLVVDDKQVVKLRLLLKTNPKAQALHTGSGVNRAVCCINFANGSKIIRSVLEDHLEKLEHCFIKQSPKFIQTFARMNAKSLDWSHHSMRAYYAKQSTNPSEFYRELHEKIISSIEGLIAGQQFEGINIVDAGCGDGELLKKIESRLQANCKLLGFDFNQSNISTCQQQYSGQCLFRHGDMLQIKEILEDAFFDKTFNSKWPVVLTLSGSLTRLVLNNGFEASSIVMDAASLGVHYVIGGGIGEPLITPATVKRIGYKPLSLVKEKSMHNFFALQLVERDEFEKSKIAKLQRSNLLDLSLCPNALKVLEQAQPYLEENSTIDFSFLPFSRELKKTLKSLSKTHSDLSLTYCHYDAKQVKAFLKEFFLRAKVSIKLVSQDAVLISSSRFFNRLQCVPDHLSPEEALANDAILNYFTENIRQRGRRQSAHWLTQQKDLLESVIAELNLHRLDSLEDDRPVALIPASQLETFKDLLNQRILTIKSAVLAGNLRQLPLLLSFYRYNLAVREPGKFEYEFIQVGSLEEEIQLYACLANSDGERFLPQAMKMLSCNAVATKAKPHSPEYIKAIEWIKALYCPRDDCQSSRTMRS
ncbi:methyltransferase domain-containing protein [Legionella jordanis]|uniref:Methyltransferase domain-containing protein n=1 Tax=Legionella jordanis TaxID=456 RepID=A0A0W0VAA1_9GAMM|nr:methyltransferase domain-containing protein [Legionella jordanis]KTD16553.1 hypothetical protein Ljor_0859 [Legionella jordanis]RMX03907.1 methyltransferase domain-containing protein [Legionella jordanis]VEH11984.1 Uncharacterised protein [Legionella jordanis]